MLDLKSYLDDDNVHNMDAPYASNSESDFTEISYGDSSDNNYDNIYELSDSIALIHQKINLTNVN